jgi:hypothetical protein
MGLVTEDEFVPLGSVCRLYGFNLTSNRAIPGLCAEQLTSAPPDLSLELGPEPDWVSSARRPAGVPDNRSVPRRGIEAEFCLNVLNDGQVFELAYNDGTHFVIDAAAERLWATWQAPLTLEDLTTYLLGPVMGFILRRRGITALHSSTVSVGGRAIALCGESESGKSTTAAALAVRGVSVLAEDISPIREENGILCVEPGYPRICLWPDAVEPLFGSLEALPLLTPNWDKRFLPLDGGRARFESQKQPLGAVYLLAPREDAMDAPRVEELRPREGLLQLVQNTYMNYLLNGSQRAAELDVLAKIVSQVPVRRLVAHADPKRIGALCELIVSDAERLFAGQTCSIQTSDE